MYLSRICAVSILRHGLIVTVCDILRLRHILCEPFKAFLCRLLISIRQLFRLPFVNIFGLTAVVRAAQTRYPKESLKAPGRRASGGAQS